MNFQLLDLLLGLLQLSLKTKKNISHEKIQDFTDSLITMVIQNYNEIY